MATVERNGLHELDSTAASAISTQGSAVESTVERHASPMNTSVNDQQRGLDIHLMGCSMPSSCSSTTTPITSDVGLVERLHSKAIQFKSWAENAKAVRVALVEKRYILDANDRNQLQKCLDTLQKSIKVTSLQSMVERLESISRQLGLKFTAGPSGTDCFISSDMFYVEVLLETTGSVNDVKIAHHGDPLSCPELHQVLSKGDFTEFTEHLEGLSSIYQLNADKKQKSKAYMALQALETDLTMLSQLQSSINDPSNLTHKSPVGILQTRRGGHAMKLTYFISPYDLLDMDCKALIPLTVDAVIEKQLGCSVMVCIESSATHKLQTQSLMSIARTVDGKSLPSFAAPTNLNSTTLPANFVLRLDKPMPLATALVRKIQAVTHIDCADLSTNQPLLSLITQQASDGEINTYNRGLFVTLPDQHHCYFLNGVSDLQGVLVSSIPFTHPTHVPQILIFLRQQALFNVLVSSCIRPTSKQDIETAFMFEVSALSWLHVTIAFEHPLEESMATAELDLSDITNVKCKLHTMPNDLPICTDEYASKVVQRCLSIPITMRALIRKAQANQQLVPSNQTNGDHHDIMSNGGASGNTGIGRNSSTFTGSSSGGGGGGGGTTTTTTTNSTGNNNNNNNNSNNNNNNNGLGGSGNVSKFVNDPDIDNDNDNSNLKAPQTSLISTSDVGTTSTISIAVTSAQSCSAQELFSVPPERASSLNNVGLLANSQLSQAVPSLPNQQQQQRVQQVQFQTQQQISQGKPNAMLMNLLNDVPQGQPLIGSSSAGSSSVASSSIKQRKQRKRKSTSDAPTMANSPRNSTGRSPKNRPSEDESSKDLSTPTPSDFDSNETTTVDDPYQVPSVEQVNNIQTGVVIKSEPQPTNTIDDDYSFTICSTYGSTIKLAGAGSSSPVVNKSAELGVPKIHQKQKRIKLEPSMTKREEREIPLGKEIEKIPIVFDITSGSESTSKSAFDVGHMSIDRRPSVEIIPLGVGVPLSQPIHVTSTTTTSGSMSLQFTTAASANIKIPPGRSMETNQNRKDVSGSGINIKQHQTSSKQAREIRRSTSEIISRKIKSIDLTKKDRKRKRLDSVDGILMDSSKPAKIINVITSMPTSSTSTCSGLSVSTSQSMTLNVKPALGSGSPSISVSVTKTPVTTTSATSTKKPTSSSPTLSPSKTISILKPTSSSSKPKISGPIRMSTEMQSKCLSSSLKIQNKNKSMTALSRNNALGGGGGGGGGSTMRLPTKPATVKLKQLNLSSSSSSAAATAAAATTSTVITTTTVSTTTTPLSTKQSASLPESPNPISNKLIPISLGHSVNVATIGQASIVISDSVQHHLTAAQRASKLLARSKKASLSSVIDKLSMQLHNTGELIPLPVGSDISHTQCQSPSSSPSSSSTDLKKELPVIGGKTSDVVKKAEFTVKPSSQGIKLTVTKTHVSNAEGVGVTCGIQPKIPRKSNNSPNSLSKIGGSSTGLKPGVNSGPASKKSNVGVVTVPSTATINPKIISTTTPPPPPPPPPPPQPPPPPPPPPLPPPPLPLPLPTVTNNPSKSPSPKLSTTPPSSSPSHVQLTANIQMPSSKMSPSGGSSPKSTHKQTTNDSCKLIQNSLSKIDKLKFGPTAEGMPPPPRPPPPPPPVPSPIQPPPSQPQSVQVQAPVQHLIQSPSILPEFALQPIKRLEEPPAVNVGPLIRPFPKLPRESLLEENEAERAFQRLLQAQCITSAVAFTKLTSNSTSVTPVLESQSTVEKSPSSSSETSISLNANVTLNQPATGSNTSPNSKESSMSSSSPDDSLVIDCPSYTPQQSQSQLKKNNSPDRPSNVTNNKVQDVVQAVKSTQAETIRIPTTCSPSLVIQQQSPSPSQSPITAAAAVVTTAVNLVAHTPLSEHSNPSSVAQSSPYDIDDDLMDEALVGLGK